MKKLRLRKMLVLIMVVSAAVMTGGVERLIPPCLAQFGATLPVALGA
jgi:hypothetical protein